MCVITDRTSADMSALQTRLHSQCMLCGAEHPQGLRLAFSTHADGHVEATFPCQRVYQGYTGYLHGGVIAALLDSAMTNCLFAHGHATLTGELNVRFLKPVIISRSAVVSARLAESLPPLFHMEADLRQGKEIMARATAKFVEANWADVRLMEKPATQEPCRRPAAFDTTGDMPATMT